MTTSSDDYPDSAVIQIANRRSMSCVFHGLDGKRLILETTEPLPVSSVISVQHEDVLFLGEIVTCKPASGPAWNLQVKVEQILTGLQSLMALRAHLLGEGVPQHSFTSRRSGVLN